MVNIYLSFFKHAPPPILASRFFIWIHVEIYMGASVLLSMLFVNERKCRDVSTNQFLCLMEFKFSKFKSASLVHVAHTLR